MTDQKRFRTEIPNIIDDLGLDPHERALYVHYKRTCGGDDCEWTESARVTAERTKMSHTRVSQARASLVKRGLIEIESKGNDGTAVRIVDIWSLNSSYYDYKEGRPNIDGWTVKQLKEWCEGVNNIYTSKEECKQYEHPEPQKEQGVNNAYTSVNNIYNKKEPKEKVTPNGVKPVKPKAESPPTEKPRSELMNEFLAYTGLKLPFRKSQKNFWWSSIGELYELAARDVELGKRLIREATDKLKNNGMSVNKPESIINTAREILANKQSQRMVFK